MKISDLFSFSKTKWQQDIVPFPTELQNIEKIKIMYFQTKKWAEFTAKERENFFDFMSKGSCEKIIKGATRYQIRIEHKEGVSDYYIHGDSLGPEQEDLVQTAFQPKKRGFEVFLYSFFA